jgi:hypothetical protein
LVLVSKGNTSVGAAEEKLYNPGLLCSPFVADNYKRNGCVKEAHGKSKL